MVDHRAMLIVSMIYRKTANMARERRGGGVEMVRTENWRTMAVRLSKG